MAKKRVFISFDYDHDDDLRILLVGQAKNPDSPFEIADWSVKEELTGDWKEKVRRRIRAVNLMIVLCGEYTNTAYGVNAEIRIAQGEMKEYFLLIGRKNKVCRKPTAAKPSDKMYDWTWSNLKLLISGSR